MVYDLIGSGSETSGEANALDLFRHRIRLAAVLLALSVALLGVTDPFVAPQAVGRMCALKVALLLSYAWLWRFASRAATRGTLISAVFATTIFTILISVPSTILVGVSWHSLLMAGVVALGAAAVCPWGARAQAWLVAGMLPLASIPLWFVGPDKLAIVPILVSTGMLAVSIAFAWQNELYALSVERNLQTFRENVRRLEQLTEHIHAVFWLTGLDGSILYVSAAFGTFGAATPPA